MYAAILIAIIALILILAVVIWSVISYKEFVNLKTRAETAYAFMDEILRKRYDCVFKIVGMVKNYAVYEKGTLERVIAAGNMALTSRTPEETIKNNHLFFKAMKGMFALADNSTELQTDPGYHVLQNQLTELEERLDEARSLYNKVAVQYNTKIQKFPGNLIAGVLSFQERPLYEEKVV